MHEAFQTGLKAVAASAAIAQFAGATTKHRHEPSPGMIGAGKQTAVLQGQLDGWNLQGGKQLLECWRQLGRAEQHVEQQTDRIDGLPFAGRRRNTKFQGTDWPQCCWRTANRCTGGGEQLRNQCFQPWRGIRKETAAGWFGRFRRRAHLLQAEPQILQGRLVEQGRLRRVTTAGFLCQQCQQVIRQGGRGVACGPLRFAACSACSTRQTDDTFLCPDDAGLRRFDFHAGHFLLQRFVQHGQFTPQGILDPIEKIEFFIQGTGTGLLEEQPQAFDDPRRSDRILILAQIRASQQRHEAQLGFPQGRAGRVTELRIEALQAQIELKVIFRDQRNMR